MKRLIAKPGEEVYFVLENVRGERKVYPIEMSEKKFSAQMGKPVKDTAKALEILKS